MTRYRVTIRPPELIRYIDPDRDGNTPLTLELDSNGAFSLLEKLGDFQAGSQAGVEVRLLAIGWDVVRRQLTRQGYEMETEGA